MSTLAPISVIPLYAGFWRRAARAFVDGFLLLIPNAFLGWYYGTDGWTAFLVSSAIACTYYAGFHASPLQATPGKLALGVKVTGLHGDRIGVLRAIARYLATWLSTVILGLGYLLAGVTRKRQALHDM